MSPKQFEDAIRATGSGAGTPRENKVFDKVQSGVTKQVMAKLVEEGLKRKRMEGAERQRLQMVCDQLGDPRFKGMICRPAY